MNNVLDSFKVFSSAIFVMLTAILFLQKGYLKPKQVHEFQTFNMKMIGTHIISRFDRCSYKSIVCAKQGDYNGYLCKVELCNLCKVELRTVINFIGKASERSDLLPFLYLMKLLLLLLQHNINCGLLNQFEYVIQQ